MELEDIFDEDVNDVDWSIEEEATFKVVNNVGVKDVDCILLLDIANVENKGLLVVDKDSCEVNFENILDEDVSNVDWWIEEETKPTVVDNIGVAVYNVDM